MSSYSDTISILDVIKNGYGVLESSTNDLQLYGYSNCSPGAIAKYISANYSTYSLFFKYGDASDIYDWDEFIFSNKVQTISGKKIFNDIETNNISASNINASNITVTGIYNTNSITVEDLTVTGNLIYDGVLVPDDAVTLTSDQSISGKKTFESDTVFESDIIISGNILDSEGNIFNQNTVNLDGDQSILGEKTFKNTVYIDADDDIDLQVSDSIIIGKTDNIINTEGSCLISGTGNTINSQNSSIFGNYNTANAIRSFITGSDNISNAKYSNTYGSNLINVEESSVLIGKYNDSNLGYAFAIGNGTSSSNRSNAFTIDWNGNITTEGDLIYNKSISLTEILETKQDNLIIYPYELILDTITSSTYDYDTINVQTYNEDDTVSTSVCNIKIIDTGSNLYTLDLTNSSSNKDFSNLIFRPYRSTNTSIDDSVCELRIYITEEGYFYSKVIPIDDNTETNLERPVFRAYSSNGTSLSGNLCRLTCLGVKPSLYIEDNNQVSVRGLSNVAISGEYDDLYNKPDLDLKSDKITNNYENLSTTITLVENNFYDYGEISGGTYNITLSNPSNDTYLSMIGLTFNCVSSIPTFNFSGDNIRIPSNFSIQTNRTYNLSFTYRSSLGYWDMIFSEIYYE